MENVNPGVVSHRSVWRNPIHFIAFGFGSGTLPLMPGTWGTVVGVLIYLLLSPFSLWVYGVLTLILIVFGVWVCGVTAKDLGVHDYSGIVWDEVVGYLLTMLGAPKGWGWVVLGFVLFRVFDIWKPWPIRWVDEKVMGGLGIVLDDLVAAVYALIVLQIFAALFTFYA
jgi:phosphatidylglycerophosphatase A